MCQILRQAPYRYYHLILMLSLVDSIFSSILQMKRLRCKELKHAQGHSQNVTKPGPPDTKVQALSHYPRLDVACLIPNDPLVELCFMNGLIQCFGGLSVLLLQELYLISPLACPFSPHVLW